MNSSTQQILPPPLEKSLSGDSVGLAHAQPASDIAAALGGDVARGLAAAEAARRLAAAGANELKKTAGRGAWRIFFAQFASVVVWLLLIAAAVAWLSGNRFEALAILVVLFLNALIGFFIEWQAGRALDALRRETRTTARVRRGGSEKIIDSAALVAGDVVILSAGDRVPADARLFEAVNLRADESALTGESFTVEKSIEAVAAAAPLAERRSMIFLGTNIVSGRAAGIVTATGDRTELGRVGRLLAQTSDEKTPLERRLADLGKRLVYVVLAIAALVMLAGYLRGDDWRLMIEVAISLAVAAVPEGLPAVTTLILALGVLRLARRSALVRKLAAVETLGSTTVICTDKTGTLTENRMTVREYRLASGKNIDADPEPGDRLAMPDDDIFRRLVRVGLLCSEAAFDEKTAIGDPTETALLDAADRFGFDIPGARAGFKKIFEQPFDAKTKRMIAVLQNRDADERFAALKGAPAVVLEACDRYAVAGDGVSAGLDEKTRRAFLQLNEAMADKALRVLAFAEKRLETTGDDVCRAEDLENGYTFLGFAGMTDPPRAEVGAAIREAKAAGIRIVMLTGDQQKTASAIARELHLSEDHDVFAFHAQDLADAAGEKLAELARRAHVFARVSPEDKLRIVEALQQTGEIVAVTGDGINDAPALKQADIGVAMGRRGTDVAKEAADIVLTDDNFSTIVKAIEGGRTIYANIIKFVHLMFSHNLGEVLVIFGAIIFGLPLPLLPLQILWVNLITDIFPAFALALEPPTPDTMRRPPRSPRESFLSPPFMFLIGWQGAMLAAITLGAYGWALQNYGEGAHARTVALLALVGVQVGHLFNCRSRSRSAFEGFFANPFVFAAAAIVIGLQLVAVYFAPLAAVLGLTEPDLADWTVVGAAIAAPVLIVETTKIFARRAA